MGLRFATRLRCAAPPQRALNVHEYQSKQLMQKFNINVQRNSVAIVGGATPEQAADDLGPVAEYVVKAQVHAGGRGKGTFLETGYKGGVRLTTDKQEAIEAAKAMLGNHLVTKQTTAEGVHVTRVMIAEALNISKEYYFAILMDRSYNGPVLVASTEGGVDIEEVAESSPEKIHKVPVNIREGLTEKAALDFAAKLEFPAELQSEAAEQFRNLYKLFIETDATQVEINPLCITPDSRVVAFDAKIQFDDNASFRQKEIFALRDTTEEDPREVAASEYDLNYIGLDGNVGCMVNGAGLAMATTDIIALHGGSPANFLDVGGGATKEQVAAAFRIISADPKVKAILVNIFGGIMSCKTIAEGVVFAIRELNQASPIPVICRLEGSQVEEGKAILKESGLDIQPADDLDDAAKKAVAAAAAAAAAAAN